MDDITIKSDVSITASLLPVYDAIPEHIALCNWKSGLEPKQFNYNDLRNT